MHSSDARCWHYSMANLSLATVQQDKKAYCIVNALNLFCTWVRSKCSLRRWNCIVMGFSTGTSKNLQNHQKNINVLKNQNRHLMIVYKIELVEVKKKMKILHFFQVCATLN